MALIVHHRVSSCLVVRVIRIIKKHKITSLIIFVFYVWIFVHSNCFKTKGSKCKELSDLISFSIFIGLVYVINRFHIKEKSESLMKAEIEVLMNQ